MDKNSNRSGKKSEPSRFEKKQDSRPSENNRSFGKGKDFGGNREERPFRSREDNKFGGAPRPERSFGDKGKSFGGNREERPFRSREDNARPERGFDDKAKSFGGAKPERSFGEKGRDFGGEREGKPFRSRGENNFGGAPRPERSFGDKGKSFGGAKPERSFDKGRTRDNNKFNDKKSGKGFGKGKKSDKDEFNFASRNHEITQDGPPSYDLRHYEKHHKSEDENADLGIRLNRHIANSGVCSRRDADKLIESGQITVNGNVVTEMGFRVKPTDVIHYGKKKLSREKLVYVLLNKPKDFITTTDDPDERKTVMQLVSNACEERIYPVGRLDRNTTGLLLLTNDGELADRLAHPSQKITKIYQVDLDKPITEEDFEAIKAGLKLEDGLAEVDELQILSPDNRSILGIAIHIGRNRIVRRIFEHLGYDVVRLDRVMYASLDKRNLPRGHWRYLDEKEVIHLKYFLK